MGAQFAGHRQLITDAEHPLGISIGMTLHETMGLVRRSGRRGGVTVPDIVLGRRDFGIDRSHQALAVGIRQDKWNDAAGAVNRAPRRLTLGIAMFLFDAVAPPDAGPRTQG